MSSMFSLGIIKKGCSNLIGNIKLSLFKEKIQLFSYLSLVTFCFFSFQQGDLSHTAISSYAYLKGHFFDFYDYNKSYFDVNPYLPLLYVIFAIWNIPLYLTGYSTQVESFKLSQTALSWGNVSLPLEIIWWKILLALIFFITVFLIHRISLLLLKSKNEQLSLIFASSPIAIFCVFIFSQYDILSVFFTLLGFYYFLKKNFYKFAWFFSVAISFKFFALIIYLPLILISEKRFFHILKFIFIGFIITLIQLSIYWHSDIFIDEIFLLASSKVHGGTESKLIFISSMIIYFALCLFLHLKKFKSKYEESRAAVFSSLLAYALMFLVVRWHPQWLIIIIPFLVFSYSYIHHKKLLLFSDIVGMAGFTWYTFLTWPHNVDVSMIARSSFKDIYPVAKLVNAELMPVTYKEIFYWLFTIYLFFPIFLIIYERLINLKISFVKLSENLIFARFLVGLLIFIGPTFFCIFAPNSLVELIKIN
jgi:hypothetical protein